MVIRRYKLVILTENLALQKEFWLYGILVTGTGILVIGDGILVIYLGILEITEINMFFGILVMNSQTPCAAAQIQNQTDRETPAFT